MLKRVSSSQNLMAAINRQTNNDVIAGMRNVFRKRVVSEMKAGDSAERPWSNAKDTYESFRKSKNISDQKTGNSPGSAYQNLIMNESQGGHTTAEGLDAHERTLNNLINEYPDSTNRNDYEFARDRMIPAARKELAQREKSLDTKLPPNS